MLLRAVASLVIGVLVWPGPVIPVWAQSFSPGQAHDAVRNGDIVPLKDIFSMLEGRYGGYQLDVELFSRPGGGSEYRIVWMNDAGRRMNIVVDAQNGRIVRTSGG